MKIVTIHRAAKLRAFLAHHAGKDDLGNRTYRLATRRDIRAHAPLFWVPIYRGLRFSGEARFDDLYGGMYEIILGDDAFVGEYVQFSVVDSVIDGDPALRRSGLIEVDFDYMTEEAHPASANSPHLTDLFLVEDKS
ncbi:MAG: hypothetical protein PHV78_01595 [Patescibacteria group bacterium]|nr:hypothetical protein [Patescibacteria group bacterium]MDD5121155.1 hypothetical protein [Patescibacteria group bacterium]MDD5221670.1 hypothetical protein [Patescibacteria group bacterium]MDD5395926.1 hypothetical protein [Patescibacteria group bacterium]